MKRTIIFIAIIILIGMQSYSYNGGRARVSFGVFFDALQPYGEWVTVADYGYCWRPTGIDQSWRPYSNGRWVWSDNGWFWDSYEEWGWAPYHYGRWTYDDYYGWIWVPDYEWGPSWVQWRYADGYVGWAPLPPRAGFHFSIGIDVGDYGVPYFGWCFTAGYGFYSDHPRIFGAERNHHFIGMTRNVTNIHRGERGVFNRGLDFRDVERMNRSRINPVRIEDQREFQTGRSTRLEGDRIRVYRPDIRPDTRNDIETRVRNRSTSETPFRTPPRDERGVAPDRSRGRSEEMRRSPENQSGGKIEWNNTRPGDRNMNRGQMQEESRNRHPQRENQPRFNIPERREEQRRDAAPEHRHTPAPAKAPQIQERHAQPHTSSGGHSGGGERRGNTEHERSGDRRR